MQKLQHWLKENVLYIAWIQAVVGMAGSLFFSEILHFPPCVLCWYQRICMYPLVAILAVGIARKDKNVAWYVLPLTIIGLGISIFHNLLYYKLIPDELAPCTTGVSCTTKFIEYFGFITIPFLSMIAFILINTCVIYYHVTHKNTHHE
jgi:disulfide bond formation protein DsbB